MKYKFPKLIGVGTLFLSITNPASAAVILQVDIADLSNVNFISTTEVAQNNHSNSDVEDGITLLGIFSDDFKAVDVAPGNLSAASTASVPLVETFNDYDYGGAAIVSLRDLTFFSFDSSDVMTFSTSSQALTGQSTLNATATYKQDGSIDRPDASFQELGYIGDIIVFDGVNDPIVIGQFEIVPEPSTVGLISIGLLTLFRRRR